MVVLKCKSDKKIVVLVHHELEVLLELREVGFWISVICEFHTGELIFGIE